MTLDIADEKYVLFTTFTKDGREKPTPVWMATAVAMTGFTTESGSWKTRRLRNNPVCRLQACNSRGQVRDGSSVFEATAREATPTEAEIIHAAIVDKYGFAAKAITPVLNRVVARLSGRKMGARTAVVISDIERRRQARIAST